jgi:hypothetical protein
MPVAHRVLQAPLMPPRYLGATLSLLSSSDACEHVTSDVVSEDGYEALSMPLVLQHIGYNLGTLEVASLCM